MDGVISDDPRVRPGRGRSPSGWRLDRPGPSRRVGTARFGPDARGSLDEEARARLGERAERVALTAGDWLFHAGDPADAMYLVASGRIEIVLEEAQEVLVRELAVGDSLGELALLTGHPRSASVRARRDAVLVRISAEDFAAVMDEGEVALELLRYLAGQLQRSRGLYDSSKRTPGAVALVPLAPDLPVDAVADAIVAELRRVRPAELLRPTPGEAAGTRRRCSTASSATAASFLMIADDATGRETGRRAASARPTRLCCSAAPAHPRRRRPRRWGTSGSTCT